MSARIPTGRRLVPLVLCLTALCGCWNYQEINDTTFVAGAAVDIDPAGGYLLTIETVDISGGDAKQSPKSSLITTSAATIAQAASNASGSVSGELYWNHAATVVVSREVAQRGLEPVLSFILHNLDTAMNLWLLVADGDSARSIFELKTKGTPIVSYALGEIVEDNRYFGQTVAQRLHKKLDGLQSNGRATLLPLVSGVTQNGEEILSVRGCAVLAGGQLVGTLDGEQTAQTLAVRGELGEYIQTVEYDGVRAAVRLLGVQAKQEVQTGKQIPVVNVQVQAGFTLAQADPIAAVRDSAALEQAVAAVLEERLMQTIRHAQNDLGCDIFGFGELLQRKDPALYAQFAEDWNTVFSGMEAMVEVKARLFRDSSGPGAVDR